MQLLLRLIMIQSVPGTSKY